MKCLYYFPAARGLGQISRNIKLCNGLHAIDSDMTALFITAFSKISLFSLPERSNLVKLPEITKNLEDNFVTLNKESLREILFIREQIIKDAIENFKPDILFIDRNLTGVEGELTNIIISLKKNRKKVRICFNIRDIIDENMKVIEEWNRLNYYSIIENYIDHVFIFGEQKIFNFTSEYKFTEQIRQKSTYCGYLLDCTQRLYSTRRTNSYQILVTVGSGIDGFNIANCFIKTFQMLKKEFDSIKANVITGPNMPDEMKVHILNKSNVDPGLNILDFTTIVCTA